MSYFNIPTETSDNIYLVAVHTADCYKYEYFINAKSAKEAQSIGYRKTFQHYADCGMKKEFHPTKITAFRQDSKVF